MRYKAPKFDNKAQWVPIVVKDKDWLIGYVAGIQMIESLVLDTLAENGVEIDLRGIDLCLDSSRFNDILENGRRESECTQSEMKKYYSDMVEEKMTMIKESHPDNDVSVFDDCFLEVECGCGLGVYVFKTPHEIPDKRFKCQVCGRTIIDYTYHDDEEFDFDGEITSRLDKITEEIQKRIDDEVKKVSDALEEDEDDEEENLF